MNSLLTSSLTLIFHHDQYCYFFTDLYIVILRYKQINILLFCLFTLETRYYGGVHHRLHLKMVSLPMVKRKNLF